jgi:hypothetical protein
MNKENVIVSISYGFQVRNFLQTKFIHNLIKSFNVIIVISQSNGEHLKRFLDRSGLGVIEVEEVPFNKRSYEETFTSIRKNIFVNPKRTRTKNILNELTGTNLGYLRHVFSFFNQILGRFEVSRSFWRKFESLFISGTEFDAVLEKYKPKKIITANYGTEPFEIRLLRSARRHKIPSIAIVPSWDNLTSKGVMGIKPDYLIVWNEIMVQEAVDLHSFKRERIFLTGPLQFDNFFYPEFRLSKQDFYNKFDIEPERPVIVYGTITPKYFKYNLEVLKILKELIENGTVKGSPKILVRVHPQVVNDPVFGDNLDEYLKLKTKNDIFCFSIPDVEAWGSIRMPRESDYKELISALTHSRICIASASTLIFDSFACNTPFIGIGFDGYRENIPYKDSVKRMFDFEHYKNVAAIGGFFISKSIPEFADHINTYLENPDFHKEKRDETLRQQIKFNDGKNFTRVMAAIKSI